MIVPYLTFSGKTEEAFNLYKSVFGGEFTSVQRFGDTPHGANLPENERKLIMHLSLQTANGDTLMGNDHMEAMGPLVVGNNFSISVHPKSEADARRIFDGLAAGGTVLMPIDKVFWGAYFGMLIDAFGVKWVVNYQYS
jgi:PhnB protein